MNPTDLIAKLDMKPHPEGGFYKETYRSEQTIITSTGKTRSVCTAIYYLLENKDRSAFHRIQSDELWFFHQGQPLEVVFIKDGILHNIILGNAVNEGEVPYAKVEANTWFGSRVRSGSGYSLVSCTVAPGFDFADFELAQRDELIKEYPHLEAVIREFT